MILWSIHKKVSYLETHYNFLLSNYAQSDPRGAIYNHKINYLPPPRIYFGGVTLGVVSLFVVRKSKTISQIKPHTYITGKNG